MRSTLLRWPSGGPTVIANTQINEDFNRALSAEIRASEQMRMRVLAATLAIILIADQLLFLSAPDILQKFAQKPIPVWLPVRTIGPFLLYELIALRLLDGRIARGKDLPRFIRIVNVAVETSMPTVLLWTAVRYTSPAIAFSLWPSMLYYIFIVGSVLRLDFALSALTGAVAACGYMALVFRATPDVNAAALQHGPRAAIMLAAGIVAGLVATRLRNKFRHAVHEAASRERVTNIFGQHVSPAVVDRLLENSADQRGERREVCVMFLDIRNFTANSREHTPEDVVEYLNTAFGSMIDAVDRHSGFINKFLGDGFMAVFGAPLDDPAAAKHAVAAAREILADIDRRKAEGKTWPLEVGIGLHIGPCVVGNVGSPRRKEFTVIGDTVNLASRLEQLTKQFGTRLIVSDAIVAALGEENCAPIPLGAVPVKGYAEPVQVWGLN
jgi:adenylate cyclase